MNTITEVMQNIPAEMRSKVKSILIEYHMKHVGKTGFGETVLKPFVKIEFYDKEADTVLGFDPPDINIDAFK